MPRSDAQDDPLAIFFFRIISRLRCNATWLTTLHAVPAALAMMELVLPLRCHHGPGENGSGRSRGRGHGRVVSWSLCFGSRWLPLVAAG